MLVKILLVLAISHTQDTLNLSACGDRGVKKVNRLEEVSKSKAVILDCNGLKDLLDLDLSNAEYLKLSLNPLTSLKSRKPYSSLKHIDISNTLITSLPEELCRSSSLKRVDCYGGSVTNIASLLSTCQSLEILNMDFVEIDSLISLRGSRLRNLPILSNSNVELTKQIMSQIGSLEQLTRLGIFNFNGSVTDFYQMQNKDQIESLSIDVANESLICEFISELSKWKKLRTLEITLNSKEAPHCLTRLQNIETLIVKSRKGRVKLPFDLVSLVNLKEIYDFENIGSHKNRKFKVIVNSPNREVKLQKMGFSVKSYSNPIYIK